MLSNEYLYLLFKFIRPNLVALGNGSVFTNLKTDILRNYNTILPDKETLTKFDGVVSVIFKQILYNTRENEKLIQLRDTLLPKLMSGEIDVSKVEIDNILENQSTDKLLFSILVFDHFYIKIVILIGVTINTMTIFTSNIIKFKLKKSFTFDN